MKMNWTSVKADHVIAACDSLLNSINPRPKPSGLVVTYRDKQLPAKAVLQTAYCLANNIPSGTKLKFSSGESTLNRLRSLGLRAERLETTRRNPAAPQTA
jgi:hypothetical protein